MTYYIIRNFLFSNLFNEPCTSAAEVIKMPPVYASRCLSALKVEQFDVWLWNLVQGLTFMIFWTSLMVKVIGQGHLVKCYFQWFFDLGEQIPNLGHIVGHHVTSQKDIWRKTASGLPEVQQIFSVFLFIFFLQNKGIRKHYLGKWRMWQAQLFLRKQEVSCVKRNVGCHVWENLLVPDSSMLGVKQTMFVQYLNRKTIFIVCPAMGHWFHIKSKKLRFWHCLYFSWIPPQNSDVCITWLFVLH